MRVTLLKSKLHRATVTEANLEYEGSVSIDRALCDAAGFLPFERVEIYNVNNGERFHTYVIPGKKGEICLNGAAARLVQRGDRVIICTYADMEHEEAVRFLPTVILLDARNQIKTSRLPEAGRVFAV